MANHSKTLWQSLKPSLTRKSNLKPRAPRIPVETPVHFRPIGQTRWCQGTTFNMSQSGVIFRTDRLLDAESLVQMAFALPPEVAGRAGTRTKVFCRGRIVRTVMPATSDGYPHLAAEILDYLPSHELAPDIPFSMSDNPLRKTEN